MVEMGEDSPPTESVLSGFKTLVISLGIEMQSFALHEKH